MTLELWNTLATCGTFLVIAVTALAAVVQLRHMRGSNQLNAVSNLFAQRQAPEMLDAAHFVFTELPAKMHDPSFRYQITHGSERTKENGVLIDKVLLVGSFYEEMGLLVKRGFVDPDMVCDMHAIRIVNTWDALLDFLAALRSESLLMGENFEYLAVLAQDWNAKHASGSYPAGVRRIHVPAKWRSDDETYAAALDAKTSL